MGLMHGHIRAFRALADAIEDEADHLKVEAPADNSAVCKGLRALAAAHRGAADRLEKQERDLLDRMTAL